MKFKKIQDITRNFDLIYQAAVNGDEEEIKKLASICCIDERDGTGVYTAAGKLTVDGNKKAALLLIKYGASVNWVAKAAAIVRDYAFIEELQKNHEVSVDYIAEGSAIGGDVEHAEHLRLQYKANVSNIARGAAICGNYDYVTKLYSMRSTFDSTVQCISEGLGQEEHIDLGKKWTKNYTWRSAVSRMAKGAAIGGYIEYAEFLRQHHSADPSMIAEGAAMSGYWHYVDYLSADVEINHKNTLIGASEGGFKDYATHLLIKHCLPIAHARFGAKEGGHQQFVDEIFSANHSESYINILAKEAAEQGDVLSAEFWYVKQGADIKIIAQGFEKCGAFDNEKLTLSRLADCRNDHFRKALGETIKVPELEEFDMTQQVPRATTIRKYKMNYQIDFDQAFALTSPKVEMQIWLLQGYQLVQQQKLIPEIFILIASFISPMTYAQTEGLFNGFTLKKEKAFLQQDLKGYLTKSLLNFFGSDKPHKKNAENLLKSSQLVESRAALALKLNQELSFFTEDKNLPKDEYYEHLNRHYHRL